MAGMDWFRWHHGSVNDPKFQLVARKAKSSLAEVIAVWATLLEAASLAEDRGNPGELDYEAIDCALGLDDGKAKAIHEHMAGRGMIDTETGRLTSWDKRQPKREREDNTNAERQKAFRERQNQITPSNATSHQKTPREEKSREEKSKPIKSKSRAEAHATATRLPADWSPSPDDVEFCKANRPDLDASIVADSFRDYWLAAAGAKGRKQDWPATWRNWVRNEKGPQPRASPAFKTIHDQRAETIAALTGRNRNERTTANERDITGEAIRVA